MLRNKIINGLLAAAMLFCAGLLIYRYAHGRVFEVKAIVGFLTCGIAILRPGKAPPPFQYYREKYDFIPDNAFRDKRDSERVRMGLYWLNRKKYKTATREFDRLLENGDLLSNERTLINRMKSFCTARLQGDLSIHSTGK